jgi:PAS domain S-box-containing protein
LAELQTLRVLLLEDRATDAELLLDELRQFGFDPEWHRVETPSDFLASLHEDLDIILADYTLPQYSASQALHVLENSGLDIPFIVVTGSISEEVAVECMKQGAADYLLKDRLTRLGPAVTRTLEDKRLREEKQRAVAALRASEEKHRLLFDNAGLGIGYCTPQGQIVAFNRVAAAHLGGAPKDYVGKTLIDLFGETVGTLYLERIKTAAQSEESQMYEDFVPLPPGNKWFLSTFARITDDQGAVVGVQIIFNNVTERKQAEQELRKLSQAVEYSPSIVYITDPSGRLEYVNPKFTEVTGYAAGEASGRLPRILDPNKISREEYEERWSAIRSGREWRGEFQNRKKSGEPFWELASISPITDETGAISHYVLVIEDITDLKRAQQQLYELNEELEQRVIERTAELNHAKERIEAILNSSDDVMILCQTDGTIEQVNPAFDAIFGYTSNEVHSHPLAEVAVPEQASSLKHAFETTVRTKQPERLEIAVHSQGRLAFDADIVLSPVVGPDDRLLGIVCSLRDITRRKQMEAQLRKMLEHEMQLSELKSRYVSMAAHDLRNPLAVIQSTLSLFRQYGDRLGKDKLEEKFDHMQSSINVMVNLLDDILTLGQVESGRLSFEPAPLDVITFCNDIATDTKEATGTTQPIDVVIQGDCRNALMDANLLRHILGNLLSNAVKYSPANRPVTFTVRCEPDQIIFRIQDQGIGIPKDDQKRLFETFHRASNARQIPGTGLGLAIVKQSVELHGGTITFESEEGLGTTFIVIIPQIPVEK